LFVLCRSQFEQEQLNNTEQRLATISATIAAEEANLQNHERAKETIQEELREAEEAIAALQEELRELNEDLEEKTKVVEQAKKKAVKSAKALDQVLKEIASKVIKFWRLYERRMLKE
jgi:structural maintenance of chromosome 1